MPTHPTADAPASAFESVATSAVKLIVWDLDDTFWRGTITEGPVETSPARVAQWQRLVDQGMGGLDLSAARHGL